MGEIPKIAPCPWLDCKGSAHVEREETTFSGERVLGVDEDNGPIYYVECDKCFARGPIASWAIDAVHNWNTPTGTERSKQS
jgi:hypothetical protein